MIRLAHVLPPSNDTAANIPSAPSRMFETMTTLFGFVGLTAIVSSASFPCRWLTSTFCGVPAATVVATPPAGPARTTAARAERSTAAIDAERILSSSSSDSRGYTAASGLATGSARGGPLCLLERAGARAGSPHRHRGETRAARRAPPAGGLGARGDADGGRGRRGRPARNGPGVGLPGGGRAATGPGDRADRARPLRGPRARTDARHAAHDVR